MDPRGRAGRTAVFLILAVAASAAFAERRSAAALLEQAAALSRIGSAAEALGVCRSIRNEFPRSAEAPRALSLSISICLSEGDDLRSRYFLSLLIGSFPSSAEIFPSALSLGDFLYAKNDSRTALEYYRTAVARSGNGTVEGAAMAHALLRTAELTLYGEGDRESARSFFRRIRPGSMAAADAPAFRTLSRRLNWDFFSGSSLGLGDENVAAVRTDGDDIWIGTWNGGVARYSIASGEIVSYPLTASLSRCIEVTDRRVWVGTAEGLSWFSKPLSRWYAVEEFRSPEALKVQALAACGDDLYAGTLGNGLFRLRSGSWERVEIGGLPGGFVTSLYAEPGGKRLFIGTMTMGLLIYDISAGRMTSFWDEHPEYDGANVTAILKDSLGRTWIGTYGDGLYMLPSGGGKAVHYTRAGGDIADDWVLCACETEGALYFGSFGGGVSVLDKKRGEWGRIGIGDGLPSLDIVSIAAAGPYLFFGTLGAGVCRYYAGGGDAARL